MARRLKEYRPRRIALVHRPATGHPFYVKKESEMEKDEEGEQKLSEVFPPVEEELEAAFKAADKAEMNEKVKAAIKGALRLLSKWKDDLPDDVKKAVGVLARACSYGDQYGYPAKKEDVPKNVIKSIKAAVERLAAAVAKLPGEKEDVTVTTPCPEEKTKGEDDDETGISEEELVEAIGGALSDAIEELQR